MKLIQRDCKQLDNQYYGSDYRLSDCTSEFNSNASNSSFYLQFYKDKTQSNRLIFFNISYFKSSKLNILYLVLDFGVRLSITLKGDILSISVFSKFTDTFKNSNMVDEPYLSVKFASNSTTINSNLQFTNDVATLNINNLKNERIVFTLYRMFQTIDIFYNIDEEISIEMGKNNALD